MSHFIRVSEQDEHDNCKSVYAEENGSDSDSIAFELENFYDDGTNERGVNIFYELKEMFHNTSVSDISECVLKTMQLLELGRWEGDKGSSSLIQRHSLSNIKGFV